MSSNPSSPSGSVAGYSIRIWLAKNKGDLKLIITAAAGVAMFFLAKVQPPELNAAISAVAAAVTKFLVDGLDFWLTENPS